MADVAHQFNNILLGGRGAANPGQLKIHSKGFLWKKLGGGNKGVDVSKDDIKSISWIKYSRSYRLSIRLIAGANVKFNGFREQDVSTLNSFISSNMGITPDEKPLAVSGRNWGEIDIEGNTLAFVVANKQAFEICVADVSQTQVQGKNDVLMEFHVDDTNFEKDTLMELSFHVPSTNTTFVGDEEKSSAQALCEKILAVADVGPAGGEAIATFPNVNILTPRGRYVVELHLSFLRLLGASDFKIQYTSVARLFCLPKSAQTLTYIVITLDPPIRKGQTFYPHIVLQFPSDETAEQTLEISSELLNTKYKDKLVRDYKGLYYEIFLEVLRGLSGAGITKPGSKFRSSQDGYAVRAALKTEEGLLYPLERSFFFLPKPPTLIVHEEIEYVEFERHGAAGTSNISSKNFDLIIRLRSEQEHQFRNISRNEYHNLFKFISEKGLKILNFESQGTSAVAEALNDYDPVIDPHYENIRNARETGADLDDSDEEDLDYTVAEKDDEGSPTDDSGAEEEEPDASDSEAEKTTQQVKRKEKEKEKAKEKAKDKEPVKKDKKKPEPSPAPKSSSKKQKRKESEPPESSDKRKKQKKDPNAPKRPMSGFMYFSQAERENLKKTQPNIGFKDISRVIGERWKELSKEEKEPYEAKARNDKVRYKEQMEHYKSGGGGGGSASD